jgi:hypothetical protein
MLFGLSTTLTAHSPQKAKRPKKGKNIFVKWQNQFCQLMPAFPDRSRFLGPTGNPGNAFPIVFLKIVSALLITLVATVQREDAAVCLDVWQFQRASDANAQGPPNRVRMFYSACQIGQTVSYWVQWCGLASIFRQVGAGFADLSRHSAPIELASPAKRTAPLPLRCRRRSGEQTCPCRAP